MIKERNLNGHTVFDIIGYDDENELQDICNILSEMYSITITNKLEGPGTTIWDIEISGYSFLLVNNTWGTFLRSKEDDGVDFIEVQKDTLNRLLYKP